MTGKTSSSQVALVVVLSDVESDPRVRRQIDWLTEAGWTVDSLGRGNHPSPAVRTHFRLTSGPRGKFVNLLRLGLIHTLLPYRQRFVALAEKYFPRDVHALVASGAYDLVLFNDTHLLPWLSNRNVFGNLTTTHIHVDLHEWFPRELPQGSTRGLFLMQGYHRWGRRFIASPLVDSRSVAGGSGQMYADEFNIPIPTLVRNAPPFVNQEPSPVDNARINLIHHGLAGKNRGFWPMVDAMRLVDDRFHLTFMLAGNQAVIDELRQYITGLEDRVTLVPPAPMRTLAQEINKYDVEVMFFPPVTDNLATALPNKLFEAIQGRLALVTGPTPTMVDVVEHLGNGVVATGWTPEDLAAAINTLTPESVRNMKKRSHAGAHEMSAEHEKAAFFQAFASA